MKNIFLLIILFFSLKVSSQSFDCGDSIIDIRDGKKYPTVLIGSQCWMQNNLNIGSQILITEGFLNNGIIEKKCAGNDTSNCEVYGGLYEYEEAMNWSFEIQGICPKGWHIPSVIEFQTLMDNLGGDSVAGIALKETGNNHWQTPNNGTNSSGFTGLPGGWANHTWSYYLTTGADFVTTDENKYFQLARYDSYGRLNSPSQYYLSFSIRCIYDSLILTEIPKFSKYNEYEKHFSELYPNPIIETSEIKVLQTLNDECYIEIYNSLGQILKKEKVHDNIQIKKSDFHTGLYFYRLFNKKGNIKTRKFEVY